MLFTEKKKKKEDGQACSPGTELNEPADSIPNYLILVDLELQP